MTRNGTLLLLSIFFAVAGICSEAFFTSKDVVNEQVIQRINATKSTIDCALYSFTSKSIAQALEKAGDRGVKVRMVRDGLQSQGKADENASLRAHHIKIHVIHGKSGGIMHNKFAIFDGKEIFTGSYNWTDNAEKKNYENAFFNSEPLIVKDYQAEFERLFEVPPIK